ncbi:hypothetical protein [Alkalihalobacillus trypoxylicola]|uniref:Uncharacterized protein n=1 Tax=Alkalihalobacillus trypoxylicola TaxID=519424 RepID=A0A161P4Z9_9BACI|nr:hypothetical protein [Alkalihalobacillus trypoxylicola]KYG27005.1 hypothetical protein AZF04_11765 [Alkalihalobacillus trypoxylicola]
MRITNIFRVINEQELEKLFQTESPDILTLDYLSTLTKNSVTKNLWQQLIAYRKQHYAWLKQFYYQLNGEMPQVNQNTFVKPTSYLEGIKQQVENYQQRLKQLKIMQTNSNTSFEQQYLNIIIQYFEYEGLILTEIEIMQKR